MLRKLAHNTLIGFAGSTANKGLAFVTTIVLARGLGQEGFGLYAFVGVYIFFFSFLIDLGIERIVTREMASRPAAVGRILGNAILLKLALCAIAIPLAYLIALLMGVSDEARACIVLAALGLPLSIESMLRSYFQSQYALGYVYAVTLPCSLLFLLLVVGCVHWALPVRAVFIAALVNGAVMVTTLLLLVRRRLRLDLRPDRALLRLLVRDGAEVGLFVLIFMLTWRLDQIILFQLRDAQEVGRYAAAVRVTEALSLLPEALMMTVFPLLAATQHSEPERFRQTYRLSLKYLSAIILPVALVLTLTRHELVSLAFGPDYTGSATPLAILAWGMFFSYAGAVYLNLFIVQAQQRLMLAVSVLALVVNLGMNFWLIPAYGATAAALATVSGSLVGFLCWVVHPSTAPFMAVCISEARRPLLCVGLAWLVVYLVPAGTLPGTALALALYSVGMIASGGVSRGDVVLVRQLFAAKS